MCGDMRDNENPYGISNCDCLLLLIVTKIIMLPKLSSVALLF